jgi:hypothetical protein
MAIHATNSGVKRDPIPAGNYAARCYQMIEIGTVEEQTKFGLKKMKKVRIGWELPTELKVFKEENGEQPLVISQEYTLSMNKKANLRKMLASWRGKDFTDEEAKSFDITKLIGAKCMLNIIHKPSADGSTVYENIGSISPIPKGMRVPDAISKIQLLEYDNFNWGLCETLPDFIKNKVKSSEEFASMQQPNHTNTPSEAEPIDDLPF